MIRVSLLVFFALAAPILAMDVSSGPPPDYDIRPSLVGGFEALRDLYRVVYGPIAGAGYCFDHYTRPWDVPSEIEEIMAATTDQTKINACREILKAFPQPK